MTEPSKWIEDDLQNLIKNKIKESVELEYKSSKALENSDRNKKEISKDVSAFANSGGGVIVYGIEEKGHIPLKVDLGVDPEKCTKEWLEQIINSNIQRRIDGVIINQVELNKINKGYVVYVVIIPQSNRSPHQAADKKFYKRFNFQSVPMEEYEVRDVSNRGTGPDLSIIFEVEDIVPLKDDEKIRENSICKLNIMPYISNESSKPAEYISINIYIDNSFHLLVHPQGMNNSGNYMYALDNKYIECKNFLTNHAIPHKMPIFTGMRFRLLDHPFVVEVEEGVEYLLAYHLLSPFMESKNKPTKISMKDGLLIQDNNLYI